jgi:UDP-N-acetylmuramoylalanine--D-glutamate ligase
MNQATGDLAVLNADDEITASWSLGLKAHVCMFSTKREIDEGLFLRGREVISRFNAAEKVLITRDDIFLPGLHNVENVLASLAVGLVAGVSPESMRETIREFRGVEHRIEFVREIDGVKFFNDSKATSVDAAVKALEAMAEGEGKTLLILGGRGKNAPYSPLVDLIESSVRQLVVMGEDGDNIESQLSGHAEIVRADSMEDAVLKSFEGAEKGDAVLLAPACASFDMFASYEERGRTFKEAVAELCHRQRTTPSAEAAATPPS